MVQLGQNLANWIQYSMKVKDSEPTEMEIALFIISFEKFQ